MPKKLGMGGEGQEQYNPNDGRYVNDGIPNKSTFTNKNNLGNDLTPQQEEYFQDSKVRDENGNLMIMYHSSNADFDIFDLSFANLKDGKLQGFWFTNNEKQKFFYGSNSVSCYINITNPVNRTQITLSTEEIKQLATIRGLQNKVNDEIVQKFINNGTFSSDYDIIRYFAPKTNNEEYKKYINKIKETTGYDGYMLEDYDTEAVYAIAFNPNQIKLVTNQNPTNSNSISDEEAEAMKYFNGGNQ